MRGGAGWGDCLGCGWVERGRLRAEIEESLSLLWAPTWVVQQVGLGRGEVGLQRLLGALVQRPPCQSLLPGGS